MLLVGPFLDWWSRRFQGAGGAPRRSPSQGWSAAQRASQAAFFVALVSIVAGAVILVTGPESNTWLTVVLALLAGGIGLTITVLLGLLAGCFRVLASLGAHDRASGAARNKPRVRSAKSAEQALTRSAGEMSGQPAGRYNNPSSVDWQRYWDGNGRTNNQIPANR